MNKQSNIKYSDYDKLMNSYMKNDIDEFSQLVEGGANINCLSYYGTSFISDIFINFKRKNDNFDNFDKFLNILFENDIILRRIGNEEGLLSIVVNQFEDVYYFDKLLKKGINVNDFGVHKKVSCDRFDPVIFSAIYKKNDLAINLLLQNNVDINIEDHFGNTALNYLLRTYSFYEDKEMIASLLKKFLSHGADPNAIGRRGNQPIHVLSESSNNKYLLNILYENGLTNINARNMDGDTPLIISSKNGNMFNVVFLVEKGAELDATDKSNMSSILVAASNQHFGIVEFLLNKGANLFIVDKNKRNILHYIIDNEKYKKYKDYRYLNKISQKHPELLEMKDINGVTPLHMLRNQNKYINDIKLLY